MVDLPPGATGRIGVTFQVVEAGQLCQDIVVTADGGIRTTARHCLTAAEAPATAKAPAATPPPAGDQPPASDSKISIKQTVPPRQRIGDMVRFRVDVTNNTDCRRYPTSRSAITSKPASSHAKRPKARPG